MATNTFVQNGVVFYRCTAQDAAGASAEASRLGAHFGLSCREGVYWLYDTRQVAESAQI